MRFSEKLALSVVLLLTQFSYGNALSPEKLTKAHLYCAGVALSLEDHRKLVFHIEKARLYKQELLIYRNTYDEKKDQP